MERKQLKLIYQDLAKKMVFVIGPRQVGKTWIAKEIYKLYKSPVYLNYDNIEDQKIIKNMSWLSTNDLVIFDELHKMKGWKNYIKGVYDTRPDDMSILVTGSAGLATHKNIGDSLAGRYFVHTILPFSLSEIANSKSISDDTVNKLIQKGGFPEPFLSENDMDADRWRSQYVESLIRTDVLDFGSVDDIKSMQNIFTILRSSVGSTVSYSSIARSIGMSPVTVKKYIQVLESIYLIFIIRPHSNKVARSILKEPKIYFYDTGLVDKNNAGARFENYVAVSLLKDIKGKNEITGQSNILSYIRNKEGKEVDFAIVNNDNNLEMLIEAKVSESSLSPNISYFQDKYKVKAIQVIQNTRHDREIDINTLILRAKTFFKDQIL